MDGRRTDERMESAMHMNFYDNHLSEGFIQIGLVVVEIKSRTDGVCNRYMSPLGGIQTIVKTPKSVSVDSLFNSTNN